MKNILPLLILSFLLTSCLTQRRIEYIQDKNLERALYTKKPPVYQVKPYDELSVLINTMDEFYSGSFNQAFGGQGSGGQGGQGGGQTTSITYPVDKDGFINYPILGKVQVRDLTVNEISDKIRKEFTGILNQPIVTVRLANRSFTVIHPVTGGSYVAYPKEQINIFEAIAMTGGIEETGDRSKVLLVREVEGKIVRKEVNLLKADVFESEYYYVNPNDLIYIRPIRNYSIWRSSNMPYILSIIGFATTIYSTVMMFYIVRNN
jgi:polysaccharide biosynthesis/export protein